MNYAGLLLRSPGSFEKVRARSLAEGPTGADVAVELELLEADDSEIGDVIGCLESEVSERLLANLYRNGDVTDFRRVIRAELRTRAERAAREALEKSWRDAGDIDGVH
jgi:hypothetical protein